MDLEFSGIHNENSDSDFKIIYVQHPDEMLSGNTIVSNSSSIDGSDDTEKINLPIFLRRLYLGDESMIIVYSAMVQNHTVFYNDKLTNLVIEFVNKHKLSPKNRAFTSLAKAIIAESNNATDFGCTKNLSRKNVALGIRMCIEYSNIDLYNRILLPMSDENRILLKNIKYGDMPYDSAIKILKNNYSVFSNIDTPDRTTIPIDAVTDIANIVKTMQKEIWN